MADNFGLKIGIEGEREFKKSLSDINHSFKVLGSEMKLVESQFDKNDQSAKALSSRNEVLTKEIEKQKEKIELLKNALQNSSESFGENDRRTQNWKIQLNNATAALNTMEKELIKTSEDASNMGSNLKDAGDKAEESQNKFSGLSKVLSSIGVAMGTTVVAASAAAVSLGKSVISAYADYEQLVGGVDTLYKESSSKLQEYAANAYKTAGMSANDYMDTVTSFSAALISSLGGDTEKAVSYADMAITDMSDNANKMGTDMGTIQTAYQGFAKQNYAMLDNLKLGYGGTKNEMERLLKDAEAISGIKYNISSYSDVVSAIHVIQESMGIAGTTAKEADATISGSINAMKSAIQNLIVGFGDANANMELLCSNVVDAFKNVMTNIMPIIENIIKALPIATESLLKSIADLLPMLLETVVKLFTQVLNTLLELLPNLIPTVVEGILTITKAIVENLPLLIEAAVQLVEALVSGIGKALPELIPAAINAIVTIIQGLLDNLPLLLEAGLQLILGLANGIINALPILIEALPNIIKGILDFLLSSIPQIINAGIELLTSIVSAMPDIISTIIQVLPQIIDGIITSLLESLPLIVQAGIDLFVSLIQALPEVIATIVEALPLIVSSIVDALIGNIDQIVLAGVQLFVALISNLPAIIVEVVKAIPQIIEALVKGFEIYISEMSDVGLNLIKGLWKGISDAGIWLWEQISNFFGGVVDKIKDYFGIHSPSTLFAEMGGYMAEGLGEGFGNEMNSVENLMTEATATAGDTTGLIAIESVKQGILDNISLLEEPVLSLINYIGNAFIIQKEAILEIGRYVNLSLTEGMQISEEESILNHFNKVFYDIKMLFESFKNGFVLIGQRIMEGIGDGIASRSSWLNRLITSYIREMQRRVEAMLGIHSPSKEYAKIGSYMAQGMGIGFVDTMDNVRKQMEQSIPMSFDNNIRNSQTADLINGLIGGLSQGNLNNQNITLKVNLDSKEIAQTIFNPLKDVSKQKGVALG